MAYVDVGPRRGQVVLLLHGQPSWGYLYRKMISPLVKAGYRVIAPDLIGMGRSDKPVQFKDYSYLKHVDWVETLLDRLRLRNITAFVQDWGSLIGLRVIGDEPSRFARIVVANGTLPVLPEGVKPVVVPDPPTPNPDLAFGFSDCVGGSCFSQWATYALTSTRFFAGKVMRETVVSPMTDQVAAAYNAPFPSRIYMSGARIFPALLNTVGEAPTNADAAAILAGWSKPLLTLFGQLDPIFGGNSPYQGNLMRAPGAQGQPHHTYPDAGHFIQEDKGPDLARRVKAFISSNPVQGGD